MAKRRPELRTSKQYIRSNKTPHTEAQLVATGDGTEVIRYLFQPGALWSMAPAPGWEALEHFTVLSGCLQWIDRGRERRLRPGDSISAAPVEVPVIVMALEPTTILYVCSQPVFYLYDTQSSELRELAVSVEEKDGYTAEHCQRLQELCARVGEQLRLSPTHQYLLIFAAYLHDIGKVKVPSSILGKPAPLTPDEWVIMRRHASDGQRMLEKTHLRGAAKIVGQHHERLDGSGYPRGLKGDQICLEAQILAVIDSYDAMTTDRPYRKALSREHAVTELRRCAGVTFSTDVVETLLSILDDKVT